jgi:proline dehydrogenase
VSAILHLQTYDLLESGSCCVSLKDRVLHVLFANGWLPLPGEEEAEMWPTMNMLRAHGIRAIIDYAAEDDVQPVSQKGALSGSAPSSTAATTDGAGATSTASTRSSSSSDSVQYRSQQGVVGRMYDYTSEAKCDHHVDIFLKAINTVGKLEGNGFAAIKVSQAS